MRAVLEGSGAWRGSPVSWPHRAIHHRLVLKRRVVKMRHRAAASAHCNDQPKSTPKRRFTPQPTGKEQQRGVGGHGGWWDVAWDLVGLDGVVADGHTQGHVAAHKGQRDGDQEPHGHDAEVHADGHGASSACGAGWLRGMEEVAMVVGVRCWWRLRQGPCRAVGRGRRLWWT